MTELAVGELNPPARTLLGPGPSNVHPRVYRAMMAPVVGHLDPFFVATMDEVVDLLRLVFQTANRVTLPISGTGSAGMEASLVNILEPGDKVVVGVNGFFGERLADAAGRCGAEVFPVTAAWGQPIAPEQVEAVLRQHPETKAVVVVHAETSTGVLQPMEDIARLTKERGALLVVDAVTSLGGIPVATDAWGADVVYSCTQKCLAVPPGLSPMTVSEAALQALRERRGKVPSWYLDLSMLERYWGNKQTARTYHHTAPITMIYALREGLRVAVEEGLEARYRRHARNGRALQAGVQAMGLELHAQEGHRLPVLTTVRIPEGADDLKVRRALLNDDNIEIGGGLGPLAGRIWRLGLMGYASSEENVLLLLAALERVLAGLGVRVYRGQGVAAALEVLNAG
ncbi:MAG: alanine--glyoxylate aminotransferase family protein [Chloroflexi bacterium]|nr:alanine--glyoxylate aminotransferase family protein [Chloroflexota bacterium]